MITVFGSGVTLEQLHAIEPIRPEDAGRRWKPIPHGELVDTIKDEVLTRGWAIEEERYTTARRGADMAGALLLGGVDALAAGTEMRLALGFLHSNARRKALVLTVGAEVRCCTNGLCTGRIIMSRVHDHTINLIDEVEAAVDRYTTAVREVPSVVAALRGCEITRDQASGILMEAGRRKLIGWAAVGRVDREYRNPTFGEHGRDNAWALLNAFTYAARPNIAPTRQMEVYDAFRRMLPTMN